jgi:DNA-binding MarR family transcriptional regulator
MYHNILSKAGLISQHYNETTDESSKIGLSKLEMSILEYIKKEPKLEKKISKQIGLDISIISPIITNLMFKSYIERVYRKRMLFQSREYFCITMEGLKALEEAKTLGQPWNQLLSFMKETAERKLVELSQDLPLTAGAIKATYRVLKFVFK